MVMKQRLLVVEDDPAVLEAMTKLLVAEGYEVLAARRRGTLKLVHAIGPAEVMRLLPTQVDWLRQNLVAERSVTSESSCRLTSKV